LVLSFFFSYSFSCCFFSFFFYVSSVLLDLHSFPTRRSSDLLSSEFLSVILLRFCEVVCSSFNVLITYVATGWMMASIQPVATERSEEHTSELQSRFDLVCRLLLEKKKKKKKNKNTRNKKEKT